MGLVVPLAMLEDANDELLAQALREAQPARSLREAVGAVIGAIHGLPQIMDCELGQLSVYIGRAGATPGYVRSRWNARYEEFNRAPSTHAIVVSVGSTDAIRAQGWERAAQLVIGALKRHGALCCSNALTGSSGLWPPTPRTGLYVVARKRRGQRTGEVDSARLHRATIELMEDDQLDDAVVREAARRISHPELGEQHSIPLVETDNDDEDIAEVGNCRREGCNRSARPRNYGFCGLHRQGDRTRPNRCRSCDREARPRNYGFCGYHRQVAGADEIECKICARPATPGNYGFCRYHRR